MPLVFDPALLFPFALPKALVSHALGYLLLAALGIAILSFGPPVVPRSPLHIPVLAVAGVYAISTLFAADRYVALVGSDEHALGLVTTLDLIVLYLGIVTFVRGRRDAVAFGSAAFAVLAVVLAYEALQRAALDPVNWVNASVERPASTLGNSTILAQYLGAGAVAALAVAVLARRTVEPRMRIVLGVLGVASATGALLTGTRSVAAGIVAGIVVVIAVAVLRAATLRQRLFAALGGVAALLVFAAAVMVTPAGDRVRYLAGELSGVTATTGDVALRVLLYKIATDEIASRPLLGVGPDNYGVEFGRFRPPEAFQVFQYGKDVNESAAHSWLAKVATDTGVLGTLAFLAVLVVAIWVVLRRSTGWRWAAAATLVSFLVTGLVTVDDVGTQWILWASLGVIAIGAPTEHGLAARQARDPVRSAAAVGGFVAAVVLAALSLSAWNASRAALAARTLSAQGRYQDAALEAARAATQDPRRAVYWDLLGTSLANAGRFADARSAYERAVHAAPLLASYHVGLSRAYLALSQSGDGAAASKGLSEARRAVELDPNTTTAQDALGLALLLNGDDRGAIDAILRGFSIGTPYRATPDPYEVLGRAYLDLGQTAEAKAWLLKGIGRVNDREAVSLRVVMARVLLKEGRQAEAVEQLSTVLAIDPQNPAAKQLLAQVTGGS